MTVRPALFADIPQIVELGKEALRRSKYAGFAELQVGEMRAVLAEAIAGASKGRSVVLVSERHDAVQGVLVGAVTPLYCTDVLMASNQFFYVAESGAATAALRLLRAFTRWVEQSDRKVVYRMHMNDAITDLGQLDKMMIAAGFSMSGLVYERN